VQASEKQANDARDQADGLINYTLTFHKITSGEGAGARFEQLDSH
jgi:hypothetical protein